MIVSRSFLGKGLAAGLLALLCLLSGCGNRDPYQRTELSGKVTLDGIPIASGEVILTPDSEQGNSGPAVVAPINQGMYQSASGNGPVAGAALVRIYGYGDSKGAKSSDGIPVLVVDAYETKIDIPKGKGVVDFELTKEQLKKK